MRRFLLAFTILFTSSAFAVELTNTESPASFFRENPEARAAFVLEIQEDVELSAEQKQAYINLVADQPTAMGDAVLEHIDAETVKWFYGNQSETEKLYDSAFVAPFNSKAIWDDCMSRIFCIWVSKGKQKLYLYNKGKAVKGFRKGRLVSTARPGKWTPTGYFTVDELAGPKRRSRRYDQAALFYAMQLDGHIFIHATSTGNYPALGSAASAGCVRTDFATSETLNLTLRHHGGRTGTGVLQNKEIVRVLVTEQ